MREEDTMSTENEIEPIWNPNPNWRVLSATRRSACDNRPGLKKIYVTVYDGLGNPCRGVKVRFDTHPSSGVVYDHPDFWGYTDTDGYVEWDHLGVPTRYRLFMGNDAVPLIENIRTDLGNEYCRQEGTVLGGWRPVNRPGFYSYDIVITRRW